MILEARRSGGAVGLASYAWDDRLHNYVDLATGRMVPRQVLQDLLRTVVDGSERRLGLLGRLYADGTLTGRQFYELMAREVKLSTNVATALAKGGWQNVTQAEWGANGAQCRAEYGRLREFVRAVENGELSAAQIEARAKLYGNTAYRRYWELEQTAQRARGRTLMRIRTVGDDRVCPACVAEEARGWQEIGGWHVPLHAGCRCDEEYG